MGLFDGCPADELDGLTGPTPESKLNTDGNAELGTCGKTLVLGE